MNSFDLYQVKLAGKIPKYILRLMYNKIPKAFVFMTCELECEERIKYLNRALESLNKQTVLPDAVFLVLITEYIDGKKTTLEFKPPETRFRLIVEEFELENFEGELPHRDYLQKWHVYRTLFDYVKDDDVISFLHELDEFYPYKIDLVKSFISNGANIYKFGACIEDSKKRMHYFDNIDYSMNGKFMKKFYEVADDSDYHCDNISKALDEFYGILMDTDGIFLELSDDRIDWGFSDYIVLKLADRDENEIYHQYDEKNYN
jgi:hypothetical protein